MVSHLFLSLVLGAPQLPPPPMGMGGIGPPAPPKQGKADPTTRTTPAQIIGMVARDIAISNPEDVPFQRYFSYHMILPEDRGDFNILFRFWLNHMSGSRRIVKGQLIEGGLILKIDIRDAVNWTRTAWEIVGNRDYIFRESWIPHRETEFIRRSAGVKQNPDTLAAVVVMGAWQFFRDSIESNRVQTYYDLLYAAERHPDGDLLVPVGGVVGPPAPPQTITRKVPTDWEGGVWPGDGVNYPKGAFKYNKEVIEVVPDKSNPFPVVGKPKGGQKNFPETGAEFEKRWGGELDKDFLKQFGFDPRVGGIGLGKLTDPNKGSFVAMNDRAVRVTPSRLGGVVSRTFDVNKSEGERNHLENFGQIALGKIKADGSEILATLPNGAQAGLLCDGNDKRVELAPSTLAQVGDDFDKKYKDVRTHMSCIICHLPNGGFIPFNEQIRASIKAGVLLTSGERATDRQVEDFYLSWEKSVKSWQQPYKDFLEETTTEFVAGKPVAWDAKKLVEKLKKFRDTYDLGLNLDTASRDFGISPDLLKFLILKTRPVSPQLNRLAVGELVGRDGWAELGTKGLAFQTGLIIDINSRNTEQIKEFAKELLRDDAMKQLEKLGPEYKTKILQLSAEYLTDAEIDEFIRRQKKAKPLTEPKKPPD